MGVFLGTLISTVCTSLWVEPYILYKHGFNMPLADYFKMYFIYGSEMLVIFVVCFFIGKIIPVSNWILWITKGGFLFIVAVMLALLMNCRQKAFRNVFVRLKGIVNNAKRN